MTALKPAKAVFLAGPLPVGEVIFRRVLKGLGKSAFKVAIDGGIAHFKKCRVTADLAIGDFDSVRIKADLVRFAARQKRFPIHKDASDLALSLQEVALSPTLNQIVGVGLTGGRPDHQLSNLLEVGRFLSMARGKLTEVSLMGDDGTYYFLDGKALPKTRLKLTRGTVFSVFSLNGLAKGVNLEGAEFPLRNASIQPGSLGLSNVALGRVPVTIQVSSGQLIVIVPKMN